MIIAVADLEGVQGVRLNFHGEFQEIVCKIRQTNPPFLHLNPLLRNAGSAPVLLMRKQTRRSAVQ